MDEPTLGVDPWSKPNIMGAIERIRLKRTVILTTHDFDLMKRAERIILLWEGEIRKEYQTFEDFHEEDYIEKTYIAEELTQKINNLIVR